MTPNDDYSKICEILDQHDISILLQTHFEAGRIDMDHIIDCLCRRYTELKIFHYSTLKSNLSQYIREHYEIRKEEED